MSSLYARRRLLDPRQVPSVPVRMIPGHPLGVAGGLIAAYIPGSTYGFRDICGNGPILTPQSAATIGGTPSGPALNTHNSLSGRAVGSPVPPILQVQSGTLFTRLNFAGSQSGANPRVWGIAIDDGQGSPITSACTIDVYGGGNELFFVSNRGTGDSDWVVPWSVPTSGDHSCGISWTAIASTSFYADGKSLGSGSGPSGNISYTGATVNLGATLANSTPFNGMAQLGFLYKKVLSASQHAQLAAEPFCMLEPAERQVAYSFANLINVGSGSGAVGTTACWGSGIAHARGSGSGAVGTQGATGSGAARAIGTGTGELGAVAAHGSGTAAQLVFGPRGWLHGLPVNATLGA